jgi:two-component system sensor kinase FixL
MTVVMPAAVAVLKAAIIIRLLILVQALRQRAKRMVSGGHDATESGLPGFGFSVRGVWSKIKDSVLHRFSTDQRISFRPPGNGGRHNARRIATRRAQDTTIHHIVPRESACGTRPLTWHAATAESQGSSGTSLRGALELLPVAILIVDGNGKMVLANRQAEKLFGYGHGELMGAPADLLVPMLGENGNRSPPGEFFAGLRARALGACTRPVRKAQRRHRVSCGNCAKHVSLRS